MQDDLDILMDNLLEENSTVESPEILNNVTLLDDEKNEPKVNLRAPGAILDDYTMLDLDNQKIDIEIEQFKQKNKAIFDEYQAMLDKINLNNSKQLELKEELLDSLENAGLPNIVNKRFKATYIAATKRHKFESDKFKKKYPVLYEQFTSTTDVKAYIKISEVKK